MNDWQAVRQLRFLLEADRWPDGATERVFGSVTIAQMLDEDALALKRFPQALLRVLDGNDDPETPALTTRRFELALVCHVAGDPFGEHALVGGARSTGQGSSQGRGVLEVLEEVRKTIGNVAGPEGVRFHVVSVATPTASPVAAGTHLVAQSLTLEARLVQERAYTPGRRLAGVDQGGGAVALTWQVPVARYDRREVVLRRAAGATAPASPTGGIGVALAGLLDTSVTDTPGAGTFSYALFAGYAEKAPGTSDRFSAGVNLTVVVT